MLGQHDGITPLQDKDRVAAELLRALGRLKAGKDVSIRRVAIQRALSEISADDRYWLETLVSRLAGENGIEAIPAHAAVLASAWAACQEDIAAIIRSCNTTEHSRDPFVARTYSGLMSSSPEFGKRLAAGKINSDEVFLRVALAHLFRRDPDSTFQMFVIDGLVRSLQKAMKHDAQSLVHACIENFEAIKVPDFAWGYVVVLWEMAGRSGFFIPEPTADAIAQLEQTRSRMEAVMGPLSDIAFAHHAASSYIQTYWKRGDFGTFAALIAPVLKFFEKPFVVIYASEEDGGMRSQIIDIPATSPEDARKKVAQMGEVRMHDDFRRLSEWHAQMQDLDQREKDS